MPFQTINGATLFYEVFGEDHPGKPPVLLIHGATSTGRADWKLVAPLLARWRRVIVPDCRGHGQSENPQHTYSFSDMAADIAGLTRALGYERAHVVGHSNGGNVALVLLVEHPEVVQTAVLQASNAYVSDDLREREPGVFDPEGVRRDHPDWIQAMIEWHGATHGPDYWQELLRLTLDEILSQPDYDAEALGKVTRPTLVIQGAQDPVNAPARHGEFLAQHIPFAEWWFPDGVSHTVHEERLFEWVERVEAFWERRGDAASEALYRLKREKYSDERETIWNLRIANDIDTESGGRRRKLAGMVLREEQISEAVSRLSEADPEDHDDSGRDGLEAPAAWDTSHVEVLLDHAPYALVRRSVTDLRREPRCLAERVGQALLGETVRVLQTRGDWQHVRLEHNGYMGWVHAAALQPVEAGNEQDYGKACNALVVQPLADCYAEPDEIARSQSRNRSPVGKLPFGVPISVVSFKPLDPLEKAPEALGRVTAGTGATEHHYHIGQARFAVKIKLPGPDPAGAAHHWIAAEDLLPLEQRPAPDEPGIKRALELCKRFIGVPYLWGGRTPFGFDCSGLSQTFYGFLGITIPHDADQQFRAGSPVDGEPEPGDLLFFGPPDNDPLHPGRQITHVAISLGGWEVLHANGAEWRTSINSLDATHPRYRAGLKDSFKGTRRFR